MKIAKLLCIAILLLSPAISKAQLTNGVTGLLHMPNADMQKQGTLMIGANYLDRRNNRLPFLPGWEYDTFNYYFNITIFPFLEMSYVCTLNQGCPGGYWPEETWGKYRNQDRHFVIRARAIKEGQFWKYMPAVVLGVSDPSTGTGGDLADIKNVNGTSNGYFNYWFIAATKHFQTKLGEFGTHLTYMYNQRVDYKLNGPAIGFDFKPNFAKGLDVISEYDAKTINIGATYSLYHDHFNFLFELQKCKYISCGVTYKVNLLGGNMWRKSKQSNNL